MNQITFADRLKSLRSTAGKSQVKVAEEIGISVNYYQRLEYGEQMPSQRILNNIADYFNEPVSSFSGPAVNKLDSPDKAPEIALKPPPEVATPLAAKRYLFRMSDGYLCTAKKCPWRCRVDENTYYCPSAGCMKEG